MAFSLPFLPLLLPLLVVFPSAERSKDIVLLPMLRSAAKENHNFFAVFSKINTIAGAEMDPALKDAASHTLDVREIALAEPVER